MKEKALAAIILFLLICVYRRENLVKTSEGVRVERTTAR